MPYHCSDRLFLEGVGMSGGGGGQFSFNFPNVIGGRGKDGFTKLNFLEKFYLLKSSTARI